MSAASGTQKSQSPATDSSTDCKRLVVGVFGDIFIDIQTEGLKSLPKWNEDHIVPSIQLLAGGSAANSARQLQSVFSDTVDVSLLSAVGNDSLAEVFFSAVKKDDFKIDLRFVKRCDALSTPSCIVLSGCGERTYVSTRGALSAVDCELLTQVLGESTRQQIDHLHFGGYFCTIGIHKREFAERLKAAKASNKGLTISMDIQTPPTSVSRECLEALTLAIPLMDVLFLNCDELRYLVSHWHCAEDSAADCDSKTDSEIGEMETGSDMLHRLTALLSKCEGFHEGTLCVALKNGANGCSVALIIGSEVKQLLHLDLSAHSWVEFECVDATGAGDAFNAGFLGEWLPRVRGERELTAAGIRQCMLSAASCGSFVCTQFGGCVTPIRSEQLQEFRTKQFAFAGLS